MLHRSTLFTTEIYTREKTVQIKAHWVPYLMYVNVRRVGCVTLKIYENECGKAQLYEENA